MEALAGHLWKHTTAKNLYEINPELKVIEVYDDEKPGFLALYYSDGKDLRWPIRTINMGDPNHAKGVLESWGLKAIWVDKRNDKSTPLPFTHPPA